MNNDSVLSRATPRTVDFSALHSVKGGQGGAHTQHQPRQGGPSAHLTPQDLESVLLIHDSIKSLKRGRGGNKTDQHAFNFHNYVDNSIKQLNTRLAGVQDTTMSTVEVLHCKRQLYSVCSTELFGYIHTINPDLALIAQGLHEATQHVINSYMNTLVAVHARLKTVEAEAHDILLAAELIEKDKGALSAKCRSLQAQLDARIEEEKKLKERSSSALRYHNDAPDDISVNSVLSNVSTTTSTPQDKVEQDSTSSSTHSRNSKHRTPLRNRSPSPTPSPSPSPMPQLSTIAQDKQGHSTSFSQRTLSLRQLQEIIVDIYHSKVKADAKAYETHQPRESLEQHLYTFLNQKYGLRALILDWVHAIVGAIARYAHEDNDVAVFGKILQNDIDEGFRFVQQQIKETVEELLRVYLRSKHPTKAENVVSQMLMKRMHAHIAEEEWTEIIKYMYNEEDSKCLINIVQQHASAPRTPTTTPSENNSNNNNNSSNNNRILYTEFINILLNFQLQGHERFLVKFKSLFGMFDKDKDGIISVEQFRELVHMLVSAKSERDVHMLVNAADPFNVGRLTFSECVAALSQELMRLLIETRDKNAINTSSSQ